jgi:hypothetical protein
LGRIDKRRAKGGDGEDDAPDGGNAIGTVEGEIFFQHCSDSIGMDCRSVALQQTTLPAMLGMAGTRPSPAKSLCGAIDESRCRSASCLGSVDTVFTLAWPPPIARTAFQTLKLDFVSWHSLCSEVCMARALKLATIPAFDACRMLCV